LEVSRCRHERFEALPQALLQTVTCAVEARLHGLRRDRQRLGGLGDAHALDRTQHEHGTKIVGQRVDRSLEHATQLAVPGQALRVEVR
jgi:hypothetical protein